jgi:hypothetical protein
VLGKRLTYIALTAPKVSGNMLKASRKSEELNDMPADDPSHALDGFTNGLRRVYHP